MASQSWDDSDFCENYERTWEISESEVHYGWLSPGESQLQLLKELNLSEANILDVGCGLGQNLVALSKDGANCFGLDISQCMLDIASETISNNKVDSKVILQQGDMRKFTAFKDIDFYVNLSIYSMEYLSGVQELRTVIHNLFKRLNPGGLFIMCFSHPSQAHRYPEFMNHSVPQGVGKFRPYNYSIKDATESLFKAGFSIERIVEQQTKNPSRIKYTDAKDFPYHFRDGNSPFVEQFDDFSNGSPHTIIYVARRQHDALQGIPKQRALNIGHRELWGYKRKIIKQNSLRYLGNTFNAIHLAPMDNVLGMVDILSFDVQNEDIVNEDENIELPLINDDVLNVSANSILGLIYKRMQALMVNVNYELHSVENGEINGYENRVLIKSVIGLDEVVKKEYATYKLGILVFVNGNEPGMGEIPLDTLHLSVKDTIQVSYVAYKDNNKPVDDKQLGLL